MSSLTTSRMLLLLTIAEIKPSARYLGGGGGGGGDSSALRTRRSNLHAAAKTQRRDGGQREELRVSLRSPNRLIRVVEAPHDGRLVRTHQVRVVLDEAAHAEQGQVLQILIAVHQHALQLLHSQFDDRPVPQ